MVDQWRRRSLREEKEIISGNTQSPSFSSTLLDTIYRSFDDSSLSSTLDRQQQVPEETMKKKQSNSNRISSSRNRKIRGEAEEEEEQVKAEISRVDKWMMEKKSSDKNVNNVRRKSVPVQVPVPGWVPDNFDRKVLVNDHRSCSSSFLIFQHSTSTSSDSSSGGGFSSSEAESVYGTKTTTTRIRSSSVPVQRIPKPIRTNSSSSSSFVPVLRQEQQQQQDRYMTDNDDNGHDRNRNQSQKKTKSKKNNENNNNNDGVLKTKSRAKKIYSEILKAKQPISPGGKIASFINALFTPKKSSSSSSSSSKKISKSCVIVRGGGDDDDDFVKTSLRNQYKSEQNNLACSSASAASLSKSCLSKATSSNNGHRLSNGMKRSVRFYPVSVIVDEDSRPCGQKSLHQDEEEFRFLHVKEKNHHFNQQQSRGVEEVALDLLKNYHRKNSSKVRDYNDEYDHIVDDNVVVHRKDNQCEDEHRKDNEDQEDEDDDDDRASYASSDLFELDNLASIGIVDHHYRYNEELPVYETTHFETNRAIANGFIL